MKDGDFDHGIHATWFALAHLTLSVVVFCCGFFAGRTWERRKAVESGSAEWRVDKKTGESSFHYLPGESHEP